MVKEENMIKVEEEDAKKLANTIVEVELSQELYGKVVKEKNHVPETIKEILEQYMNAVKVHKEVWRDLLAKYIPEEKLLYYRDMYRYDIYKKVIFLPEIKE